MTAQILTAISITIAAMSALIALATYLRGGKKDSEENAAHGAKVITTLEHVADDVKDIKADMFKVRTDLDKVRETATRADERARTSAMQAEAAHALAKTACESAQAAHKRLDTAGIGRAKE